MPIQPDMPVGPSGGGATAVEAASQGRAWRQVAATWAHARLVQGAGSRVLFVGCGTAGHIGQAVARLLEERKAAICDACTPGLYPGHREYDTAVFISRSGSTSETVAAARSSHNAGRKVAIVGCEGTPLAELADETYVIDPVPESAIVQTVFPTSVLAFFRLQMGDDIAGLAGFLDAPVPEGESQDRSSGEGIRRLQFPPALSGSRVVFLGEHWASALAGEAALKLKELTLGWAEAYVAPEFRHGPISGAGPTTLVWQLGPVDLRLAAEIRALGSPLFGGELDPMVELAGIYQWAVARAVARGLDPDAPRHLKRSVIL